MIFIAGVRNADQGAEPSQGTSAREGRGDSGTEGWEEQHEGELNSTDVIT